MNTDFGTVTIGWWADWFADQERITPNHGGSLNEWDLILTWAHAIPRTPLTFSLTYDYWVLPPYNEGGASHDSFSGSELWFTLAFDDSVIFGRPVLNPSVVWVRDIDDYRESWIDIGVTHTFSLASSGLAYLPVIRHLSITPKIVIGVDDGYVDAILNQDPETRLASINYSLTVSHNLGAALGLHPAYGGLSIRGVIQFKDQMDDYDNDSFYPVLRDELYGGIGLTYSW